MLPIINDGVQLDRVMRVDGWPELIGQNLKGKTLGIIGLGKVGRSVANVAKTFGMKVIAWGPTLIQERAEQEDVQYASLSELLKTSDVVSLHVRLVPETTHLLKAEHFAMMKPSAVLINTSRGKVVDENALIEALRRNEIGGAGLDVFEYEPLPDNSPLRELENTLITPHIGWKTEETFTNFLEGSIENVYSFFMNGEARNVVNGEVLDKL